MTSAKDVCKYRNRGMHDRREGMPGKAVQGKASVRMRYRNTGIDKTAQLTDGNKQAVPNGAACFDIKKCGKSAVFYTRTISALFYLPLALSV